MTERRDETSAVRPPEALIAVRGVCKGYRNGGAVVQVLEGLDFDLEAGETIAIIGASGIGKSTLLHILGTLDRPDSGRAVFQGREHLRLSGCPAGEVPQRIASVSCSNSIISCPSSARSKTP